MHKVQVKRTYGQEEDLYESVKDGRKNFCGHDWSISGEFDWELVLDQRSRRLNMLLLEFLHEDQEATAKENGRVLWKYDVTWYPS